MAKALKRVKTMSQLKVGDRVLVVHDPEVVEVTSSWDGREPVIDGENYYAHYDEDLHDAYAAKVYKISKK